MFEHLGEHDYDHDRVSPPLPNYNCIAWAAGEDWRSWWPGEPRPYHWPLPSKDESIENFVNAFGTLGYTNRDNENDQLEDGIEKVAIYADDNGIPTHAARQLESGAWTSKCGEGYEDIEHKSLGSLEGTPPPDDWPHGRPKPPGGYGHVVKILRRDRKSRVAPNGHNRETIRI